MMRRSCVWWTAFAAAVMIAAGTPAAAVTVNEGEDLAAAISTAAAGGLIELKSTSGTGAAWPLSAPVTVTQDLTIKGEDGLLPTLSVIEGNSAGGACNGNVVDNGDFEAGQTSPWISNPPVPPVIVNDPGQGASGDWYARLTLDACTTPTGLAPDQVELRYRFATPVPTVILGAPESVRWNSLGVLVQASTELNIWLKIHAPAPAGETLTFTLNDGTTDHVLTLNSGQIAAESAGDVWKRYSLPVGLLSPPLDPGDTVVSLNIEALFPPNPNPTVVLIGAVQFSDAPLALPNAGQLDVPSASVSALQYPLVDVTVQTYGPQAVRLGGLTDPALRFSARAETPQPGDKLELMLRLGDAPVLGLPAESLPVATCQSFVWPLTPGPSVMPVFRATIQPPAAVAGPVTKFVIDDVSVSILCDWLLTQVNNASLIPYGDMEDVGQAADRWSAVTPCDIFSTPLPASYFGPGCPPSTSALRLTREIGAPSVVSLTQNVTFPPSGSEIRFKLKVGQPGGADSTFRFDVSGTPFPAADAHAADAALGSWKEYILPYPAAWHGTSRTLRFSAELVGGVAPPSFLIDDVCIGLPPGGPVLSVANNATLRLENLTVSTGTAGVSVTDTSTLEFVRCATDNITGPGLRFSAQGRGTASNAVFTGCSGPAVLSDSTGTITVYQCTAKGNTEGIRANSGRINLVASIIQDGSVTGEVYTWLNLIPGGFPPAYEQAGYENLDPATTTANYINSPWIGKLVDLSPVLSGYLIAAADPWAGLVPQTDRAFDFEREVRSAMVDEELQVGADQVGGVVGTPMWMACTISPSPAVIGPGESVTITVLTQGIDLGIASLRIVPEEPQPGAAPDPYLPQMCYEIPLAGSNSVTISFSGPRDKASVLGPLLYAEGNNRIYLNDGTDPANPVLYGDGMPGPTAPGVGDCSFLVDTTPPTLLFSAATNNDGATAQPRVYANDSLVGTGIPGPQGVYEIPVSGGTIVDRALHFLVNPFGNGTCADTAASGTLTFGIEAVFEDRPPAPLTTITTSGFQAGTSATFADKQDGQAWLEGSVGPVINTVATYDTSATTANIGRLRARFDGEASQSVPDPWRFEGKPAARDRAGNETVAPNPLVLWWMWRAQAEITNGPRDTQTLSPRFDWKLRRNIAGPDAAEAAPLIPYVKAKLWRGADPAADREISTMTWVPVTPGWSGWISGPITTETVIAGSPLSTWLSNNTSDPNASHTMMLTLVGADEAGNIQPAGLANNAAVTVADLAASCVSYTWWYNGQSQENVSVDTEARVTLWELAPGPSERSFGSVARVPLPPAANRLQARAVLTARLPESIRRAVIAGEVSVARAWIKWTLYEDGNPVAPPRDFEITSSPPLAGGDFIEINLPVNPTAADGLVLGDMKNRKREKRYVLTAQTVLKTMAYVGGLTQERFVTDPTPASVSFTVYPKEVDDKLRDERPTRIYERE